MKVLILVACIAVSAVSAINISSTAERCQYGDETCLKKWATSIFQNKFSADLMSLDPVAIEYLKIAQSSGSVLGINVELRDAKMSGLSKNKVTSIKGFQKDPNGRYELRTFTPRLILAGPYKATGRILALPIQGNGMADITIDGVDSTISFTGNNIEKDGKTFLQIKKVKMTFDVSRLNITLSNLFNGDKILEDTTNQFFYDNWKDIFEELKPSIFDSFGKLMKTIMQNVFDKVSYNDIFAQ